MSPHRRRQNWESQKLWGLLWFVVLWDMEEEEKRRSLPPNIFYFVRTGYLARDQSGVHLEMLRLIDYTCPWSLSNHHLHLREQSDLNKQNKTNTFFLFVLIKIKFCDLPATSVAFGIWALIDLLLPADQLWISTEPQPSQHHHCIASKYSG